MTAEHVTDPRVSPDFSTRAHELVAREPVFVGADDTLRSAAEIMWHHDIGLLVVGGPNEAIGVLSERDLAAAVAKGLDTQTASVRTVMTDHVATAGARDTAFEVALQMLDHGIRHVPVVEDGSVVGVVSLRDLIRPLVAGALTPDPGDS